MKDAAGYLFATFALIFTGLIVLSVTHNINWAQVSSFWHLYEAIILTFAAIIAIAVIIYEVVS